MRVERSPHRVKGSIIRIVDEIVSRLDSLPGQIDANFFDFFNQIH
ncbi:hypothetical protein ACF1BQ_030975 [Bradyrhizobium sp. RDT10]